MKHRFMLHSLSHTILVVDITQVGLPREVYPQEGKSQPVSALRFQTWKDAEQYLVDLGARADVLNRASAEISKTSLAVLTIL